MYCTRRVVSLVVSSSRVDESMQGGMVMASDEGPIDFHILGTKQFRKEGKRSHRSGDIGKRSAVKCLSQTRTWRGFKIIRCWTKGPWDEPTSEQKAKDGEGKTFAAMAKA